MAAAVRLTRMAHIAADLRIPALKSQDFVQNRRLLVLAMILEGHSRDDIARRAGMDRQRLRDWVLRYNELDVAGLVSRAVLGSATKLSHAQIQELRVLVSR